MCIKIRVMMKNKYILKSAIFLIGCLIETYFFPTYDPTLSGYGTAVAYQGQYVDVFLDPNAITNEGPTLSPYGIVTIGTCIFDTTALPNYPMLSKLPCISRFNRDGTPDTNFGAFFPGTGSYMLDSSTTLPLPAFENGYSQFGKFVYMNQSGSVPTYFVVYRNQSANPEANCFIYKYQPLTGRIDYTMNQIGGQNIPLVDNTGIVIVGGATVTSACSVPVSGTAQTSAQTTSDIYITYYDTSGNSYIAALTFSTTTNLFTYDTTFATHGVIKFASGTGGAGTIQFNSINYDSIANAGAGALIVAGVTGNGNVVIARYKNLTATAALDTAFNTTGYAIVAAPGGTTPTIISQFIFSKIISAGTHYYYCAGWNAGTNQINICYLNSSTAVFSNAPGAFLQTVSTVASGDNYQIYDMVQIPDFATANAVAVAVGVNISGQPTLAGIVDFRFETPTLDLEGHSVALTEVNSLTALGQSSLNLAFYSCLFDPSLYVAYPLNLPASLPGIFVGGNFGPSSYGCFVNYTYKGTPTIGMIPVTGVRTGTGFFDYVSSEYPNGFTFEQVFYSTVGTIPSYYITGYAQDAHPYSYPGIFQFNITNNSFGFTL